LPLPTTPETGGAECGVAGDDRGGDVLHGVAANNGTSEFHEYTGSDWEVFIAARIKTFLKRHIYSAGLSFQ
jgi:hypothetical protein